MMPKSFVVIPILLVKIFLVFLNCNLIEILLCFVKTLFIQYDYTFLVEIEKIYRNDNNKSRW